MKKVSTKQRIENNKLKIVYNQIAEERGHYCTGCGQSGNLSHSHIIPRSRRKDLVLDPRNITYHCLGSTERTGCHQLWEGTISQKMRLLDYHVNMEYILDVDTEYYYLLTELSY
tara:strand:+ start:8077 stop:8418 length:342 start_codon:yes stop_codon:yes gene_type:complete